MPESELWVTSIFNDYLSAPGNAALRLVGMHAQARPWADFVVMQIVVVVLLMAIFAILRPRLSPDRPGALQHIFEMLYGFVKDQAEDQVGHSTHRYLAFFGTLFLFILTSNLIGLVPCFESPIEIISHLARLLSLTVRLYANMFAGEQVTLVFLNLTKFLVPVIFMGLHIFVGVVQAYIFMLLAMVYVGGAVAHDH